MKIALDATYSLGRDLSGVGVYSREMLLGLAESHPEIDWRYLYRLHRFGAAAGEPAPENARRGPLVDWLPWRNARLFHGLNQRLPRRRFARQVATFHDLFVMTAEYSAPDFRQRFTAQARHAAAEADRIIAVSTFTAEQVVGLLRVEPGRVRVVHHGVRPLEIQADLREKVILHVGAIQKRKNLVRLVRAFDQAALSGWRLVLAGSSGFGAHEVGEAIDAARSRERILVTGYLNDAELAKWYSRAMVFAFPSLDEGFGMPVLEAMSAGIPVLASGTSAVGEIAGSAAYLIDPRDEEQLTAALNQVCSDPELRIRLTAAGFGRAAEFRWSNAVEQTFSVYRELL